MATTHSAGLDLLGGVTCTYVKDGDWYAEAPGLLFPRLGLVAEDIYVHTDVNVLRSDGVVKIAAAQSLLGGFYLRVAGEHYIDAGDPTHLSHKTPRRGRTNSSKETVS